MWRAFQETMLGVNDVGQVYEPWRTVLQMQKCQSVVDTKIKIGDNVSSFLYKMELRNNYILFKE